MSKDKSKDNQQCSTFKLDSVLQDTAQELVANPRAAVSTLTVDNYQATYMNNASNSHDSSTKVIGNGSLSVSRLP